MPTSRLPSIRVEATPARPAAAGTQVAAPRGWPLLRLGFRPFYLGATAFAALAVPVWVAMFLGWVDLRLTVSPLLWHAHEMLFGFAAAVVVGFLLTAGKAWTGLPTPRGPWLGALAVLWLAARLSALVAPYPVYAALDVALIPLVAVVLVDVLVRARSWRNLPLAAIVLLLTLANASFHLAVIGTIDVAPLRPLFAALALIVMIECVIAGRVIPAFTVNATPGLRLRLRRPLEAATLALSALALAAWVFVPPGPLGAATFAAAALAQLLRQLQWRPWVTRGRPILWILHAAYVWIPIGFALLATAQLALLAESAGVHALAVGATSALIIGMVTRTARGHTGRPLQVSRLEVLAYVLVLTAAAVRVGVPLVAPQHLAASLIGAAVAWSTAFGIYIFVFAPWLVSTRLDGKDG
ncbi:MAG: NnrS family protein [Ideonella sp.]|nr:NnrS family protein [Ideonella sp.]MCC7455824.1 NnrS family protein [Nitrospira sp.]